MALRNLLYFDSEVLRKKSRPVVSVDDRVRVILDDMAETMYHNKGSGLAAPQVGILKRLVVIDVGDRLLKLVNPEIIKVEGHREVIEGCLSLPDRWGKVMRPKKVTVKALNENGGEVVIAGENELAKAFCHEIDHLDGVLFIDRVREWV
ncbi:MAG: peptide deformylase [Firmicutes bacterium]|nr:peptide deformylase [Bacillota bacterium]